jgi:hypothetical protein
MPTMPEFFANLWGCSLCLAERGQLVVANMAKYSFFSDIVSIVVSSAFARHLAGPRCRPLHLPLIRWIAEAGSVPGLANLHGRFGFNSTWLTSAALFSNNPDFSHGPFVWSIAATVLLYGGLVAKGLQALRYRQNVCGAFCLIGATLVLVLPSEVSFRLLTSTDLSTALFVLHAIASSIALREVGADHAPRKNFSEELLSLACAIP